MSDFDINTNTAVGEWVAQTLPEAEEKPGVAEAVAERGAYALAGKIAESPKSDAWQSIKDALRTVFPSQPAVDFSGDITAIDSKPGKIEPGQPFDPLTDGEVTVKLDSGLQATVTPEGIKFEQLNTAKPGELSAAWYSKPVGELDFSELQKSSIGPGEGGFAERIGDPDAHVDLKTQNAAVALYEALQNTDKGDFSPAEQTNANRVMEQLKPFLSIPARSDKVGEDFQLNNIQADKQGGITLEYRGDNKTKDVVVNGDKISIEYYQQPKGYDTSEIRPAVIDDIKVELDLAKIDSWTPEQKQEAGDLKAALESVDTEALTPAELKAHDTLLTKLDDVPATLQAVNHDDGMQSISGSALIDYMDKVNPPKTFTLADDGAVVNSPLRDYASSEEPAAVKPKDE